MYVALLIAVGLFTIVENKDKKRINNLDKLIKEDHISKIKEMAKEAIQKSDKRKAKELMET